jgi:hypothetical protein
MTKKSIRPYFITAWLLAATMFCLQSCDDQAAQLKKQNVQFTFSTEAASANGRAKDTDLPENARLRVSIETSAGTPVFTNHEIDIIKAGDSYMADPVDLMPGAYVLTDFMIVSNNELLYATPKAGSRLSAFVTHALPYAFAVTENSVATVTMQVIDGREYTPEEFGYASFKANIVNILSVSVFKNQGGQTLMTTATAELRQGKKLIKTFSLAASINTIAFAGAPNDNYTLTVYTKDAAKVMNFNFKELKEGLGRNPLKITLEPALILTMQSYTQEGEEWGDDFELELDGTGGTVHINWGDGGKNTGTLPYIGSNEYTYGTYTAIVTGDIHRITDLWGFAYETYITAIDGLTNLTALKTYNPSWGAVPIHVDLSNCKNLETIFIEKYGAPYDPIDLRTDFKLPSEHYINNFVFYAPGLEEFREKITADELDVMVTNIYNNTVRRAIYGGRFIVTPVSDPSPRTQEMLNALQNHYGWRVDLNTDEIYDFDAEAGRENMSLEARRENWLRDRAPGKRKSPSARMVFVN